MARARSKHDNASAVPVAEARRLLEELRKERQLPARGTTASADSMLDMLDEVINGGGIAFAANQLVKWARTFPTREDAEATHPWHDWMSRVSPPSGSPSRSAAGRSATPPRATAPPTRSSTTS